MDQASDSGTPRKRGRPPGSKNKPRLGPSPHGIKAVLRAAQPKKRGRPRKVDVLAAQRLARQPLALPPPTSFAEIIMPSGESYFDGGGQAPSEEEVAAASPGGNGSEPPPDDGPGASTGEWHSPQGRKFMSGRRNGLDLNEHTLQRIWLLGVIRTTMHEAASKLGVSHKTFQRFLDHHPVARETWVDAHNTSKVSLRSQLFEQAMSGNVPILVHMSKNHLGMRSDGGDASAPIEGDEAAPEVENKGGQIKRIVFELVSPKN